MKFTAFLPALLSLLVLSGSLAEENSINLTPPPVNQSSGDPVEKTDPPPPPPPNDSCGLNVDKCGLGKVVTVPGGG